MRQMLGLDRYDDLVAVDVAQGHFALAVQVGFLPCRARLWSRMTQ